jgi:hypothetical protein
MDIVKYAEEREKCLRELEQTEAQEIERAWNGLLDLYRESEEMNGKRVELLQELYRLSFGHLEVQYANISETFRTQITDFDAQKARIYPIVHYRVLPNELVFDIDADDPNKAKEQLKILIETIEALGANPLVGHSGNRGYHVHLLFAPPNGLSEEFLTNPATTRLKKLFWRWIAFNAKNRGLNVKFLDFAFIQNKEHTIRAFYSFNPKGKDWKVPIKGTRYQECVYIMSKELALQLLNDTAFKTSVTELEQILGDARPRYWIERILRHPHKVKDGRKRVLYHILIPYLVTVKKMSQNDAIAELANWLEQTGADTRKYQSWLRSNVKLTAKKQIKPMSYQRFTARYPELAQFIL